MKATLIQETPNPIETIAKIASICYGSDPKNAMALVKHLYRNGHTSVFEHIYFTFKIEEISRACLAQITRHRHCSFTVRSQRYCDESEADFINPVQDLEDIRYTIFYDMMCDNSKDYKDLQKYGLKNEDARYILPNATCTELYLSCNLRELMHLANERMCMRAQWEIRELVKSMCKLVNKDLQFMLVPKCGNPAINCIDKCKEHKNETDT